MEVLRIACERKWVKECRKLEHVHDNLKIELKIR